MAQAVKLLKLPRSSYDYKKKEEPLADKRLRSEMKILCEKKRRYGQKRVHVKLRAMDLVLNHKRTERLYREEGLQITKRKARKKRNILRKPLPQARSPYETFSADFVHDELANGRRLRFLTLVDDFSKEVHVFTDTSITGAKVTEFLSTLPRLPSNIRVDNGPEFRSKDFLNWAQDQNINISFIEPGKPQQNAFIESFNGKFRDEFLNEHIFENLKHTKNLLKIWLKDYSEDRPHFALKNKTPKKFLEDFIEKERTSGKQAGATRISALVPAHFQRF